MRSVSARMALAVAVLCAGVGISGRADADFDSGNSLHKACTDDLAWSRGYCLGYVSGAIDTWLLFEVMARRDGSAPNLCLPANAELGQLRDVVMKYLKSNPEERHDRASTLVLVAFQEAFPCER